MIKKIIYRTGISFAAFFWLTACDTFLDEMPDRRTEIDTNSKVGELLVSAYPTVDPMMIYEHRTDNAMDNGKQYGIPDQTLVENYHWDDISDTSWDGPEMLWNGCYSAMRPLIRRWKRSSRSVKVVKTGRSKAKHCSVVPTHIFC